MANMKISALLTSALVGLILVVTSAAWAGPHQVPPLVSTQWLQQRLGHPDVVTVDVRGAEEYATGHIDKSISLPFIVPESAWTTMTNGLLLELPAQEQLFDTLSAAGITKHSLVVVINSAARPGVPDSYPRAEAARVALTLVYLGVREVAILDGGITKWMAEGRPLSTEVPTPAPATYRANVRERIFVSKDYVERSIGRSHTVILDARDTEVYNGTVVEPFAPRPGHIPTAKSLPSPLIWNADGTYRSVAELEALASSVIGSCKAKEIIVYCGVGGYASGWWYVLSQVLGYKNVRLYDGSAQEWAADPDAPLVTSP